VPVVPTPCASLASVAAGPQQHGSGTGRVSAMPTRGAPRVHVRCSEPVTPHLRSWTGPMRCAHNRRAPTSPGPARPAGLGEEAGETSNMRRTVTLALVPVAVGALALSSVLLPAQGAAVTNTAATAAQTPTVTPNPDHVKTLSAVLQTMKA